MTPLPAPPHGCFDGPRHAYAVRVYHEDTDASGLVYHATYLRWFERARSDILALLGIDQWTAIERGEGFYVVSDMQIRWRAPARLGDGLVIAITCEEAGAASMRMVQRAIRNGQELCAATVRIGFVGPDGKPRRQPGEWRAAFAAIASGTER